jgi:hypothetical protein
MLPTPSDLSGVTPELTQLAICIEFEALAKTYPHDDGVRMTADLARWLLEERATRAADAADHRQGRAYGDARARCPSRAALA